jgi:hypothetical protein
MREIDMPDIKLPDIKLPEGLRDMTRDDIVRAAQDMRSQTMELPKKIEMPDIDLSKIELPKQLTDRMPGRRRTNPLLPIAGLMVVGAAIAAIWWLFTSSLTGPRVRSAVSDLKQRVTGDSTDMVRYDNDENLGSLLSDDATGATIPNRNGATPAAPGILPEGIGQSAY